MDENTNHKTDENVTERQEGSGLENLALMKWKEQLPIQPPHVADLEPEALKKQIIILTRTNVSKSHVIPPVNNAELS